MPILVQLSDIHIGYPRYDPERCLQRAVEAVVGLVPRPVGVLLSGDLTHHGTVQEYARLQELLIPLQLPVFPLMGNHDHRERLHAAFPHYFQHGPHYAVDLPGLRLVCLDTTVEGRDAGKIDGEMLQFLRDQCDGRSLLVAMHHPPMATGMDEFDRINLTVPEREHFEQGVAPLKGLQRVVAGHIHRTLQGRVGNLPVLVCPSIFLQAQLDLRPGAELRLEPGGEGLAVHQWEKGQELISHILPLQASLR